MRRAILFRHHDCPALCVNRIALLRCLNPGLPIYGMYGGEGAAPALDLDDCYTLPFTDPRFKWQNGDLCIRRWFIDRGAGFTFGMLYIVEWDLIFLKPITVLFASTADGVGMTHVENLAAKRAGNWPWIMSQQGREQLQKLRGFVREKYGLVFTEDEQLVGDFPGTCLSRLFLERYAKDEIPAWLHDEIRVPLFAQIYGMSLHETGLRNSDQFWDCSKRYTSAESVYAARGAQQVFHPVRDELDIERLLS